MWYGPFEAPLRLKLRPSPKLTIWILAWTLLALLAIQFTAINGILKASIALLSCVYGVVSLLRCGCLAPMYFAARTVSELYWDGAYHWRLRRFTGTWLDAELQPGHWSCQQAIILNFHLHQGQGKKRRMSLVLVNDGCEPDDFRRLRARLSWLKDSPKADSVESK